MSLFSDSLNKQKAKNEGSLEMKGVDGRKGVFIISDGIESC